MIDILPRSTIDLGYLNACHESEPTNVPPQIERLDGIVETLVEEVPTADIFALSEIVGNNGPRLADELGMKGFWAPTDRVEEGEHIGVVTKHDLDVTFLPLDERSTACFTYWGGIAIGFLHLTYGVREGQRRTAQLMKAIKFLAPYERAILMGDFNRTRWQEIQPEKLLAEAGFQSAFPRWGSGRMPGVPVPPHREYLKPYQRRGSRVVKFVVDGAFTRGVKVTGAKSFKRKFSDHPGYGLRVAA